MGTVVDRLNDIGIQALDYKRGPAGKYSFAISVQGDRLRIWEGGAEITVSTNKRKKQAVITVKESPRVVRTIVNTYINSYHIDPNNYDPDKSYSSDELQKALKSAFGPRWKARLRERANVIVPGRATTKILEYSKCRYSTTIRTKLEIRTVTTKTSFLVGYDKDGSRPFVSQLREVVSTVDEAHKSLLPRGITLKDGYQRQGEWFFNPVSQKMATRLTKNIDNLNYGAVNGTRRWSDNWTSHQGNTMYYKGKRYAIGIVEDNRRERHTPLFLNGWYEVVRNNEAQVVSDNRRSTTWD